MSVAQVFEVVSPNNILSLSFNVESGVPVYQVTRFGRPLIVSSKLGLILNNDIDFSSDCTVSSIERNYVDNTWTQVWGEKKEIRNCYHELKVVLVKNNQHQSRINIYFRVFNDGIAFRYCIPKQDNLKEFQILDEITEFNMAADHNAWWIPAYHWNRYEYLYKKTTISQMDTVHTPVTFETENGIYLSIHEAALTDYASMTIIPDNNFKLKADLVPWADGIKVYAETPFKSPWRSIQIADTPGELITSYIILNLNEPCKLRDTSWIRPGKYVGIWWEMHLGTSTWGSGELHGATTENTKRYIDFASKYGFSGVLVEGWNIGWDGDWIANSEKFDFITPYPDFDIDIITQYAKDKGVRLIGHHETAKGIHNYEDQMTDAYKFYKKYGVRSVKTGYVGHGQDIRRIDSNGIESKEWHHGQWMVRHYRKSVKKAAKYKLMIDAHEPIKATGIRRTYPNIMTREGARGQEFNAWSADGGNPPEHTTILPFTRLLGGPMDFTPGIFDLIFNDARPNNRVNTTLMKQLALYVILYSPLQMAADLPENYLNRLDAFQFIMDVPVDWQDTQVLHAKIGDYVTIVRKDINSPDWYLGSITDEEGRNLQASLQFLDVGKKYVAQIYCDGQNADWKDMPYEYEIKEILVDSHSKIDLRLAPGGGQAIRFKLAEEKDIVRLAYIQ
ncbi:glycoside hydrolase family 97 protein [bacterium]|nr:glycoside hydrolase family 97 protein [bacterium]